MNVKYIIKKIFPKFLIDKLKLIYNFVFYRLIISKTQKHYKEIEASLRKNKNKPLRVATYVIFDSTFGASTIMELMLNNLNKYVPRIVIIPDVSRGESNKISQYKKTKSFFIKKYGSDFILDGWNEQTNEFLDLSNQFDIIYLANPYDFIVNKVHGVKYLSTKNVLPIYITYGFIISKWYVQNICQNLEMNLFWKLFCDTTYTYEMYKKYLINKGKNVCLSGYAKMDELSKYINIINNKKRILIAPHHTISMDALPLSNFLEYKDFIPELPKIFPDVEFIFRPHPLLFTNMINEGYWNEDDICKYLNALEEKGIKYSVGGDYLELFASSDALIHDCGSYMVEWLYTGKPCCYVLKSDAILDSLNSLANKSIEKHEKAYSKDDIINFIKKVVTNEYNIHVEDDVKNNIMINYPNVSNYILKEISLNDN